MIAALYVVGAVLAYGLNLCTFWGFFSKKYPMEYFRPIAQANIRHNVIVLALLSAIIWPVGIPLAAVMCEGYRYGLRRPFKTGGRHGF